MSQSQDESPYTPEEIVKITYTAVEDFLQGMLNPEIFRQFILEKNNLFPTWNHIWQKVEPWLKETAFDSMHDTIISLARLIRDDNDFIFPLRNSLGLHTPFWNKVYINLRTAQERINTKP